MGIKEGKLICDLVESHVSRVEEAPEQHLQVEG